MSDDLIKSVLTILLFYRDDRVGDLEGNYVQKITSCESALLIFYFILEQTFSCTVLIITVSNSKFYLSLKELCIGKVVLVCDVLSKTYTFIYQLPYHAY